jgi:hypothetical protein
MVMCSHAKVVLQREVTWNRESLEPVLLLSLGVLSDFS